MTKGSPAYWTASGSGLALLMTTRIRYVGGPTMTTAAATKFAARAQQPIQVAISG